MGQSRTDAIPGMKEQFISEEVMLGAHTHTHTLAIRMLKQEDCELDASLSYIARPRLKGGGRSRGKKKKKA